jgi:hypothetical protein
MNTKLVAMLLLVLAAVPAVASEPEKMPVTTADNLRQPAHQLTPASLTGPSDRAERGKQCADKARAKRLVGDDYRHFMIRCMNSGT